jgi:nitrogen-specific signal transduction histidine kinase
MQLHVVLPAKAGVVAVVVYYISHFDWFYEEDTLREVVVGLLQKFFVVYVVINLIACLLFLLWRRLPPGLFQWLSFTLGLLDGLCAAGVAFIAGGFESIVYWVFPGLIVLNAISIPLALPQIGLNLVLSVFYLTAGVLDSQFPVSEKSSLPPNAFRPAGIRPQSHSTNSIGSFQSTNRIFRPNRGLDLPYSTTSEDSTTEPLLPRLFVLWLLTACCYGVQVLVERQRRTLEEEREFAMREGQLHSAGRLAAEFAHQIKNPLAIINNAAFSLQRALQQGRYDVSRQIEIIQEEVERSDKIVTQIMGYAQLSEGRVEKLNVAEELNFAIEQVFPAAVDTGIEVERNYPLTFPPLLMQRGHLSEILVNLLQNAREALNGKGRVIVAALCHPDDSLEISVQDNGPGIAPDKLERVFEAYYTTKEKGTGLGLAIVKHNVELYAGKVRVESGLGKGARFILSFPAKAVNSPAKYR